MLVCENSVKYPDKVFKISCMHARILLFFFFTVAQLIMDSWYLWSSKLVQIKIRSDYIHITKEFEIGTDPFMIVITFIIIIIIFILVLSK